MPAAHKLGDAGPAYRTYELQRNRDRKRERERSERDQEKERERARGRDLREKQRKW